MAEILSYEQVDICYNGVPAVKDVSFALQKSEILVIAGESGSGKSTLIRAAMGLSGKAGAGHPRGYLVSREESSGSFAAGAAQDLRSEDRYDLSECGGFVLSESYGGKAIV